MKGTFITIGVAIALVVITVIWAISVSNKEKTIKLTGEAQQTTCEAFFSNMWEILKTKAGVANEYREAFKEIYPQLIEGRYSQGDGTLMKWIQESNPNFDTSLYKDLILQATDSLNKGEYESAISCIENAETILLDKASHVELKRKIESALVIRNQENEALKAQQAIEQSRIESNRVPLSEKIERLDKLPTIFGNVKTWMKVNQIEKLENSDVEVLANKIVDVYSKMRPNDQKSWSDFKKWSDLSKVIGDKETKNIFDKLK